VALPALASPTTLRLIAAIGAALPGVRFVRHEPVDEDAARAGARAALGIPARPALELSGADVVVALDADVFTEGPAALRSMRHFAERRAVLRTGATPNRLYVAEPCPTITGAKADHRLRARRSEIPALGRQLAQAIQDPASAGAPAWVRAAAADLRRAGPRGLIAAGIAQGPEVHSLVWNINARLGAIGVTVRPLPLAEGAWAEAPPLESLDTALRNGELTGLLVLGCNPVATRPDGAAFADVLRRVPFTLHQGLYADETGAACAWHAPLAHDLESWGDLRAFDGSATIRQPLMLPLFGGRTIDELLAFLLFRRWVPPLELVRETWGDAGGAPPAWWAAALERGIVPGTALAPLEQRPAGEPTFGPSPEPSRAAGLEINLVPHPSLHDGRHAENAWLQELPHPITTQVWGNALQVPPSLASELRLRDGDAVQIEASGTSIRAPIMVQPGHADGSATLTLGHGRTTETGAFGVDAYPLRSAASPWLAAPATIRREGGRVELVLRQNESGLQGADLVRELDAADTGAPPPRPERVSLPVLVEGAAAFQWGMSIDLGACTGCGACVLACQAENNIPSVGASEAARGRIMHWIRVDRYYRGAPEDPRIAMQPVPCMQCETAPCELVCPVGATQHSHDGLNDMVYNRCIGTRYCSNNCPYKVRRFNFLQYSRPADPVASLAENPRVTVRTRGVMEKCTYCVQRIRAAEIVSRRSDRPIPTDSVRTACQQVCPARAITFGDINDPASAVSKAKSSPHDYALLAELNTRPRTTYLPVLRNPSGGAQP
jgi:molybdopterin-containing oxidoreductase family iron-sulfur binding subunit